MKINKLIFIVIALLFGAAGIFASLYQHALSPVKNNASHHLFAQNLKDTNKNDVSLLIFKGKPLIVNFWATWCAPCVEEMPELNALQSEIASKEIQIIGIGIDSAENIRKFADQYNISYPLYTAGLDGTALLHQFGNQTGGLPFTVLINADGTVKKTLLGGIKFEELRKNLDLLLP